MTMPGFGLWVVGWVTFWGTTDWTPYQTTNLPNNKSILYKESSTGSKVKILGYCDRISSHHVTSHSALRNIFLIYRRLECCMS